MNRPFAASAIAACLMAVPAWADPVRTESLPAAPGASAMANVVSTTPARTQSMERLTDAAQRLREAIQAMAQAPSGARRNAAIEAARVALLDTQRAMIELPPELRVRDIDMSDADYARAMDSLKQAAQRLRESAQAMAQQPAGERRNAAIEEVNQALLEINQAMIDLPWQPPSMAAGSPVVVTEFDQIDKNQDGSISRAEYRQHIGAGPGATARAP